MSNPTYSIAIHGGAGSIDLSQYSENEILEHKNVLGLSLEAGFKSLKDGDTAINAVINAVKILEDSPLFNAGKGSVVGHSGLIEMDASIMCGKTLSVGGATCVKRIKNPIVLAEKIRSGSIHSLLSGDGAEEFAFQSGLTFEDKSYFYVQKRLNQWRKVKDNKDSYLDHSNLATSTVGAVALDINGDLAAATSTGGMTNKLFGRVSDTSIIGAGNYANNKTLAISGTGMGDYFIRNVFCYDVSALMEYQNHSLEKASIIALKKLKDLGGEGGLIAISKTGEIYLGFNSKGMFRGYKTPEKTFISIN